MQGPLTYAFTGQHAHVCTPVVFFFFQAEDGIRDLTVTGVQTCALPICGRNAEVGEAEAGVGPGRGADSAFRPRRGCSLRGSRSASSWPTRSVDARDRSEERRVGKEGRSRWWPYHLKKKREESETSEHHT